MDTHKETAYMHDGVRGMIDFFILIKINSVSDYLWLDFAPSHPSVFPKFPSSQTYLSPIDTILRFMKHLLLVWCASNCIKASFLFCKSTLGSLWA